MITADDIEAFKDMNHPDDCYIPSPGYDGAAPSHLYTAHVRHNDEVWTDNDRCVCSATNFETAKLIARLLRQHSGEDT